MQEVEKMIKRYNRLSMKLSLFSQGTPIRYKIAVVDEMRAIAEDLNAIGLELDYFGRWI